jgi:hypothetical protein
VREIGRVLLEEREKKIENLICIFNHFLFNIYKGIIVNSLDLKTSIDLGCK